MIKHIVIWKLKVEAEKLFNDLVAAGEKRKAA